MQSVHTSRSDVEFSNNKLASQPTNAETSWGRSDFPSRSTCCRYLSMTRFRPSPESGCRCLGTLFRFHCSTSFVASFLPRYIPSSSRGICETFDLDREFLPDGADFWTISGSFSGFSPVGGVLFSGLYRTNIRLQSSAFFLSPLSHALSSLSALVFPQLLTAFTFLECNRSYPQDLSRTGVILFRPVCLRPALACIPAARRST